MIAVYKQFLTLTKREANTTEGVNLRDEVDVESLNEGVHNDHLVLKLNSDRYAIHKDLLQC